MRNSNKNRVFRYNRRIRGLTDYRQRLKFLKSGLPRAVIRASNNNTLVQIVEYNEQGDRIIVSAKSNELKKLGSTLHTGNLVSAYLTGLLVGKKAKDAKVTSDIIVDFGLQYVQPGNRLYAAVKGLVDAGMNVRVNEEVFPSEERLNGEHLKTKDAKTIIDAVKKKIGA
jgi:large subunit ribosomal protein L18